MNDLGSVVVVVPHMRIIIYGAKVVKQIENEKRTAFT